MTTKLPIILAAATLATLTPTLANAQGTTTDGTTTGSQTNDDNHFPWGLLGLIGLAGLIPRKRTVHVDGRTNR